MLELAALIALSAAPAAGGALVYRLLTNRDYRPTHMALAVGQIPVSWRSRRTMAVRRRAYRMLGHGNACPNPQEAHHAHA